MENGILMPICMLSVSNKYSSQRDNFQFIILGKLEVVIDYWGGARYWYGNLSLYKKKSFDWYKNVVKTNGESVWN